MIWALFLVPVQMNKLALVWFDAAIPVRKICVWCIDDNVSNVDNIAYLFSM